MLQMKKQRNSAKELNKTEMSSLHNEELKVMIIKMLTELGRRMDEHSENFNKELENIKKNKSELKNTITEVILKDGGHGGERIFQELVWNLDCLAVVGS